MFIVPKNSAQGEVLEEDPTHGGNIESPVIKGMQTQSPTASVCERGAIHNTWGRTMENHDGSHEEALE